MRSNIDVGDQVWLTVFQFFPRCWMGLRAGLWADQLSSSTTSWQNIKKNISLWSWLWNSKRTNANCWNLSKISLFARALTFPFSGTNQENRSRPKLHYVESVFTYSWPYRTCLVCYFGLLCVNWFGVWKWPIHDNINREYYRIELYVDQYCYVLSCWIILN